MVIQAVFNALCFKALAFIIKPLLFEAKPPWGCKHYFDFSPCCSSVFICTINKKAEKRVREGDGGREESEQGRKEMEKGWELMAGREGEVAVIMFSCVYWGQMDLGGVIEFLLHSEQSRTGLDLAELLIKTTTGLDNSAKINQPNSLQRRTCSLSCAVQPNKTENKVRYSLHYETC